jgi:hypothetical protein
MAGNARKHTAECQGKPLITVAEAGRDLEVHFNAHLTVFFDARQIFYSMTFQG